MCNSCIESSFQALQTNTTCRDCTQFRLQFLVSAPIPKSCSNLIWVTLGWGLVEWDVVGYHLSAWDIPMCPYSHLASGKWCIWCCLPHLILMRPFGSGFLSATLLPFSRLQKILLLLFSHYIMSDSLWPRGLQHARLLCPSLSPGICWDSCPLSHCCYLTLSSSAAPFSFCLQSFPALKSFPMSQLFTSGGQSIGHWCRKYQAVISSLIRPLLISAVLFPIMPGMGDLEVLWTAKVLHVFWGLSSSLSLYPLSFLSGLSSRWTGEGQGSGLFLEPHGSMTNPLDTHQFLSSLHW